MFENKTNESKTNHSCVPTVSDFSEPVVVYASGVPTTQGVCIFTNEFLLRHPALRVMLDTSQGTAEKFENMTLDDFRCAILLEKNGVLDRFLYQSNETKSPQICLNRQLIDMFSVAYQSNPAGVLNLTESTKSYLRQIGANNVQALENSNTLSQYRGIVDAPNYLQFTFENLQAELEGLPLSDATRASTPRYDDIVSDYSGDDSSDDNTAVTQGRPH